MTRPAAVQSARVRGGDAGVLKLRKRQCAKCPWRVDVDPTTIPNGYSRDKHAALKSTIAHESNLFARTPMMACHEHPKGGEVPCVGWLVNQLGPGNNIGLRMQFSRMHRDGQDTRLETVGEQHACFEDTLP